MLASELERIYGVRVDFSPRSVEAIAKAAIPKTPPKERQQKTRSTLPASPAVPVGTVSQRTTHYEEMAKKAADAVPRSPLVVKVHTNDGWQTRRVSVKHTTQLIMDDGSVIDVGEGTLD